MRGRLRATVRMVRAGNTAARVRVMRDGAAATRIAALGAGVRSGVLTTLERRPLDATALAAAAGAVDVALLEAFLRVLEANGLVRSVSGRWGITARARDVLADPVARAAALAYGGYHTDLYLGLPRQLSGGPARTDIADEGETIARLSEGFRPFVEEAVRGATRDVAPRRVLDVGCGSGHLLATMLDAAPGAVGLGIDSDGAAVDLARRSLAEAGLAGRAEVVQGDAAALGTLLGEHGGPADLALLANVIYYTPVAERASFLRTLASALRPGGTLLLVTSVAEPETFSRHFDLLLRAQGLGMELPDVEGLRAALGAAGFRDVVVERLAPGVPLVAVTAQARASAVVVPEAAAVPETAAPKAEALESPTEPAPPTPVEETPAVPHEIHLTGDDAADALLTSSPLALLIGMLLDQQVPMETAFAGPAKVRDRLGGLDAAAIAAMDPTALEDVCRTPPAVHRYPGAMAKRIQALCAVVVEEYDGDAAALWTRGAPDGAEVLRRLKRLPGFGEQKARIFLALLGKQLGLEAPGWREAAGPYGEEGTFVSVADVVDAESLGRVRETKRAAKAQAKATPKTTPKTQAG